MAEITNIDQLRNRKRKVNQEEREDRLLEVIDDLVFAFWEEGVKVRNVKITWTDDDNYIRQAKGEQR